MLPWGTGAWNLTWSHEARLWLHCQLVRNGGPLCDRQLSQLEDAPQRCPLLLQALFLAAASRNGRFHGSHKSVKLPFLCSWSDQFCHCCEGRLCRGRSGICLSVFIG